MAFQFKTKKLLTRPTISMKKEGAQCFVKIERPRYISTQPSREKPKEGEKPKAPPTLMDVINLETGELAHVVVAEMIRSTLESEYPDNAYVGKCFHILNRGKVETKAGGGQMYNKIHIEEIEEPEQPKESAKSGGKR